MRNPIIKPTLYVIENYNGIALKKEGFTWLAVRIDMMGSSESDSLPVLEADEDENTISRQESIQRSVQNFGTEKKCIQNKIVDQT